MVLPDARSASITSPRPAWRMPQAKAASRTPAIGMSSGNPAGASGETDVILLPHGSGLPASPAAPVKPAPVQPRVQGTWRYLQQTNAAFAAAECLHQCMIDGAWTRPPPSGTPATTALVLAREAARTCSMSSLPLRIGTRGSPMALWQPALVRDRLVAAHPALAPPGAVEIVTIRTTGDRVQDRRLAEIGGKGLFTKEIDQALIDGHVDLAVHSLKDVETWLPEGLEIACVLARNDPRDAFLSETAPSLAALPQGACIGTASLRRQAQLLRRRADLRIVPIPGIVNTRMRKLADGEVDAVVLALCGLQRLGQAEAATEILSRDIMLPAVGQGALAVECRGGDEGLRGLLDPLHDPGSAACVAAERAMLAALDGSCRTPIAGLAELDGDRLTLEGLLLKPDGRYEIRGHRRGAIAGAQALGTGRGGETWGGAGPR